MAKWAVTSNVATLTLSDTTTNKNLLKALLEDKLVHGSWTNWRTVTLLVAIGNVPLGDYAITSIDTTARTITFAVTAANGSATITKNVLFYLHRIAGDTTKARVFEAADRALMSDSADGEGVPGVRRRDRLQGFKPSAPGAFDNTGGFGSFLALKMIRPNPVWGGSSQGISGNIVSDPRFGDPRIGKDTRPKSLIAHLYIWGRDYRA